MLWEKWTSPHVVPTMNELLIMNVYAHTQNIYRINLNRNGKKDESFLHSSHVIVKCEIFKLTWISRGLFYAYWVHSTVRPMVFVALVAASSLSYTVCNGYVCHLVYLEKNKFSGRDYDCAIAAVATATTTKSDALFSKKKAGLRFIHSCSSNCTE